MTSRDAILTTVRRHLPESSPLSELDGPWITFSDPVAQFAEVLEMIGGRCVVVPDVAAMYAHLQTLPPFADARRTLSLIPGLPSQGAGMDEVSDPHELEDVDFAILPGEFAVAENAAVWVTDAALKHRVAYFLCQHLALVVPAGQIVNNLGEAYQRIRIDGPGFGAFIAGPSKTADIEQSLVIGAHGPKSMTVFLLG
jgi:L-lactate dehydrogenase complex protein LldG